MHYLKVHQLPAMLSTLKNVIVKISALTLLMASVFGAVWSNMRESTSFCENFREASSTFLTFSPSV